MAFKILFKGSRQKTKHVYIYLYIPVQERILFLVIVIMNEWMNFFNEILYKTGVLSVSPFTEQIMAKCAYRIFFF